MPHISSKRVNDRVLKKLYDFLFLALSSKNVTQKQQRLTFQELLTPTEKIMLSKRLMAISMLSEDVSSYKVGKVLNMTTTTTYKLQVKIEKGTFTNTIKLCSMLRKGPLQHYLDNLLKPLPRYGTSPAQIFKEK